MLLLTLLIMLFSTSLALLFAPSPIMMGAMVLLLAFKLGLILSLTSSSWFALLLFLIYIGGLLVMFSYFIAICPNHPIKSNRPTTIFFSSYVVLHLILNLCFPTLPFSTLTTTHMSSILSLLTTKNLALLMFLTLILFFSLILVVKITLRTSGPLRPFTPKPYAQLPKNTPHPLFHY